MQQSESFSCPFCEFVESDSYFLLQHVELIHPEDGDSPFIAKDVDLPEIAGSNNRENTFPESAGTPSAASPAAEKYVPCPYDCGEQVTEDELTVHTDFHIAERMAFDEVEAPETTAIEYSAGSSNDKNALEQIKATFTTDLPKALRNEQQQRSSLKRRDRWSFREFLLGPTALPSRQAAKKTLSSKEHTVKRLGQAELGPYAHEKEMPEWLKRLLEDGAKVTITNKLAPNGSMIRVEAVANETPNLVPTLARLSDLDPTVDHAFYCSPEVRHIVKMSREGGFCGYRNIQMLISYIRGSSAEGHEHFEGKVPSILKLQDMIERAWEMGFNSIGKIETGGIKGTRKYIGTPEAQALFESLLIPCQASAFSTAPDLPAYKALLLAVGEYFSEDTSIDLDNKIHMTSKPPIYLQHQGHSMTIVGIEMRREPRALNLIVFDPMYKVSPALQRLKERECQWRVLDPAKLIKAYRRGVHYLSRYKEFELLK
ncbi:hypothetical protein UCRPC4_g00027 [Phaeomoniella chlamydospora]|uniref:UFSP1/2/DUB catalytic domain-containing protein n=1 Tax=Phaeomoniella chlamydospora TaxID=158046 RepID=A0A0G2F380_PHACM|nr:hypothetical protein UCRPC4_g00027 [Phaeomoniella chlamydospora]